MTSDQPTAQPMLPGLEEPERPEAALVTAARRTIAALDADNLLTEQHALPCALLLALADAVDAGRRGGKAAAVAMAAAQLRETWQALPQPEGGDRDAWDELAEELRSAAALGDAPRPHPAE